MAGWTTLVQAETLAMALNRADLVVIDCRYTLLDPSAGEQAYLSSHLPGAAYAHLERDLSDMTPSSGDGRHPWPSAAQMASRLSRWGIGPDLAGHRLRRRRRRDRRAPVVPAADAWPRKSGGTRRRLGTLDLAGLAGLVVARHDRSHCFARNMTQRRLAYDNVPPVRRAMTCEAHLQLAACWSMRAPQRASVAKKSRWIALPGTCRVQSIGPIRRIWSDGRFKSPMQLAEEFRALARVACGLPMWWRCAARASPPATTCWRWSARGSRAPGFTPGSWSGWISDVSRPIATGA